MCIFNALLSLSEVIPPSKYTGVCVCVIDTFFSPIINNGCYNPKRLSPLLLCTRVIFFFHIIQSIPIDTVLPNKKRGASGGGWGGARTGHSVYTHSCDRWVMAVVVIIHHPIYIYRLLLFNLNT